jgi:glycosyltransferase involved in cell wall biosynthesis
LAVHILFVHNDYGRFSGEEEAVERISSMLASRGHRISWLRKSSADIAESLGSKAHAFAAGIWSPASRREMVRMLCSERPDIVHVQNLYPLISSSVLSACRERGVPVVMRCPNYRLFCPTGLHLRDGAVCELCLGLGREWNCLRHNCEGSLPKTLGYAARNAFNRISGAIIDNVDRFLVLSMFQKARFEAAGIPSARLTVLPNVAPVDAIVATAVPAAGEVIYAGRFSKEKGFDDFLEAARRLPHVPFAAAGDTFHAGRSISRAPPNVRFTGFLRGPRLERLFAESSVVVCPSRCFEGFPNLIAQAMAHGRPVVGARIGVIPEIVEDGVTGVLCPPGDAEQLAAAIDRLWRDPALGAALGERGRISAEQRFAPHVVNETLIKVYQDLIEGQESAREMPGRPR